MLPFLAAIETEQERALCEALYYAHRSAMFSIARSYLKNDHDAEDIVQTVFCEVADKYIGKLIGRTDAEQRRFLFIMAKHRSLNLIKKNSPVVSLDDGLLGSGDPALVCTDEAFIEALDTKAIYNRVVEAIKKLAADDSALLWLRFGLDFGAAEIADSLSEKRETITKRLQRAKRRLLSMLETEGGAA